MNNLGQYISLLADYTTLVYHEARNVRHLIHDQVVEPEMWKYLISLPVNRDKAWETMQDSRSKAQQAHTVQAILSPFEQRFKLNLDQLQTLFENPAWHGARFGGNAWADITRKVKSLAVAIDKEQYDDVNEILSQLSRARHNTGFLAEKLQKLDTGLRP
jgi:hypothetical protein